MDHPIFVFLLCVLVVVGCVGWFRRVGNERRSRPAVDWLNLDLIGRLRAGRDVVQSYGQSAAAVVIGLWFVLVALAKITEPFRG